MAGEELENQMMAPSTATPCHREGARACWRVGVGDKQEADLGLERWCEDDVGAVGFR
jgi:hypothetical protein